MNKVRVVHGQVPSPGDILSMGKGMMGGLQEVAGYVAGRTGVVISGFRVSSLGGILRQVWVPAGYGVAGGRYRGIPFIQSANTTLALDANALGVPRYDLIAIRYRDSLSGSSTETFYRPGIDLEYSASTYTYFDNDPLIGVKSSLVSPVTTPPGWLPLAEVQVDPGVVSIAANKITDKRHLRRDGLIDWHAWRMASDITAATVDPYGGGCVTAIIDFRHNSSIITNDRILTLDSSIDWRDRFVFWESMHTRVNASTEEELGTTTAIGVHNVSDLIIKAYDGDEPEFLMEISKGFFYTHSGISEDTNYMIGIIPSGDLRKTSLGMREIGPGDGVTPYEYSKFWAKADTGELRALSHGSFYGTINFFYSPAQRVYT